jgi:Universal stress protein family
MLGGDTVLINRARRSIRKELEQGWDKMAEVKIHEMEKDKVDATCDCLIGPAAEQILRFAKNNKIDLIVMGSRRYLVFHSFSIPPTTFCLLAYQTACDQTQKSRILFPLHPATFLCIFLCRTLNLNCFPKLLSTCIPVGTKASFFAHGTGTRIYCGKYRENNLQEPPKSPNLTLFLFVSLIYLFQ